MIELLETPTFVVDDLFDCKYIRLFDYFEHEDIPCEVLELCSAELPHRVGAYYPIIIDEVYDNHDLFAYLNPRAMQMAQEKKLILVFIYTGNKNLIFSLNKTLVEQLIDYRLTFDNIRIVSEVKPIAPAPSYIYFSFAELEAYMDAHENDYVDGFCETPRDRVFSLNVDEDTAHSRLFCASTWYHALNDHSYMNYPTQAVGTAIVDSEIYHWNKHWSATETLMDMFGQQLPITQPAGCELDYYNNAYWYFSMMPSFKVTELSLSKAIFKPILNLQPFVVVGPSESLGLLRSLGYKTFKKQVNESYDRIASDEERMQGLFRLVYEMSHFTGDELSLLNDKLRNTIIHNQQHLLSPKKHRLVTLLNMLKTGSH